MSNQTNQSASRHTPEPWQIVTTEFQQPGYPFAIIRFAEPLNNVVSAHVASSEDAARIVSCVNALAGMNPEAVKDVVSALESVLKHFVTKESFPAWNDGGTNDRFIELATIETQARAALAALKGSK